MWMRCESGIIYVFSSQTASRIDMIIQDDSVQKTGLGHHRDLKSIFAELQHYDNTNIAVQRASVHKISPNRS